MIGFNDMVGFKNGQIQARNNPDNALAFYRVAGLAHWSPSSLPDDMERLLVGLRALRESGSSKAQRERSDGPWTA